MVIVQRVVLAALFGTFTASGSLARQCQQSWWQRDAMSHHSGSLVYADQQRQTLLVDSDIWGWNGSAWSHLPPTEPAVFSHGVMAYDRARGRLVSVDGTGSSTLTTREWDGTHWELHSTQGPSSRQAFALAFDASRGHILLVGGRQSVSSGPYYGDMWEWDGSTWTLLQPNAITPRAGHSMVYDEARGRMVLRGGKTANSGTSQTNETWEWDQQSWTLISAGPSLDEAAIEYHPILGRVLAISGWPSPRMWEWTGASWSVMPNPTFKARRYAGVAFDRNRNRLVVSGGELAPSTPTGPRPLAADTWEWDTNAWTQTFDNSTPPRSFHAMAYDQARGLLIAFGGDEGRGTPPLNQTLQFDGSRWLVLPAEGPPARSKHTMVYDPARNLIVLHGGVDAQNHDLRDTWTWDGSTWTLAASDGPPSRGPVMAFDPATSQCLLVPGNGELWAWDGSAWTRLNTNAPEAEGHCVAFDSDRGCLVVDHGTDHNVWEWNPAGWRAVTPNSQRGIIEANMVFDPRVARCVRYGGIDLGGDAFVTISNSTWEWDGVTWRMGSGTTNGLGRSGHAMAWDSQRNRVVIFGGQSYAPTALADTWSSSIAGDLKPLIFVQPQPRSIASGLKATFSVETGSYLYNYLLGTEEHQWYLDGTPLQDGPSPLGTITGSRARVLSIDLARPAASGQIHCVVSNPCASQPSVAVTLAVRCAPDLTTGAIPTHPGYAIPDGSTTSDDFFFYLAQYAAGNLAVCDLTTVGATNQGQPGYRVGDGRLTSDDFVVYMSLFAEGC